ncbi:unnamed protein product, partial [marine sediment metagenome]
ETTFKGLGKTKGRIEDITKIINKMEKSLKFTIKKDGKDFAQCPTCQKELTKEHYNEMRLTFQNEIKVNQNKVETISKIITNCNKEIKPLQKNFEETSKNLAIHQNLMTDFKNFKKYEEELKQIKMSLNEFLAQHQSKFEDSSLEGIKNLTVKKEKLSTELKAIVNELNEKNKKLRDNINRLEILNNEIQKMKDLETQIGEFEVDIDHINKAKEFVRRFVTEYMVVKRLVKNIAITTNKYIKDFT